MFGKCVCLVLSFALAMWASDSRVAAVLLSSSGLCWWWLVSRTDASRISHVQLWSVALLIRALALCASLEYSDDVYRYVWEGCVILEGQSPFAFAPLDPQLATLASEFPQLHARVNHPEVAAAYPPLTQAVGVLAALFARALDLAPQIAGVCLLRFLFVAADLWLLHVLRRSALAPGVAVAWGWCPLVALEFSGSAHFDSLGILLLVAALLETVAWRQSLWLALGGATKYLPLLALGWQRSLRSFGLAALLFGACWLPLAFLEGAERGWAQGLEQYAQRWAATSLLQGWLGLPREFFLGVGIACCAIAWWKYSNPWRGLQFVVGAWLVLSPVLHPWYGLWILPLAAVNRAGAWLLLIALLPLFYWPLTQYRSSGVWSEPAWLVPCVGLPCLLWWCWERWGSRAR